jgi:hypothetical protein
MKKCPKCAEPKDESEFYTSTQTKSGLSTYCKPHAINANKFSPSSKPERRKKWRDANITSMMVSSSKKRARKAGVPHTITREDIIIPDVCPVMGIPLYPGVGRGPQHNAPSLDRIIPELGYIPGNIQVISHLANSMKRDASPEQLRLFAEWVLRKGESG